MQFFLGQPKTILEIIQNFRTNDLFENNMTAPDRDSFIQTIFSLPESILPSKLAYCGLEDGTYMGTWDGYAFYREPGNSGYTVDSVLDRFYNTNATKDNVNYKHFKSCFNWEDGSEKDCILEHNATYIKYECVENPLSNSNNNNDYDPQTCQPIYEPCLGDDTILCKQYSFDKIGKDDVPRGYVPLTSFCLDETGRTTQTPGQALDVNGGGTLGDCTYAYGNNKPVDRSMPVDEDGKAFDYNYAFCIGKTNEECQRMFHGSWFSEDYDPRIRPWYMETKRLLRPSWAEPYPFSSTLDTGITLSYPIFSEMDGDRQRFEGVCAIDYTLTDFTDFLVDTYGNSSTLIILYEAEPPHRVIGASTGTDSVRNGEHISIKDFYDPVNENPLDEVLVRAYKEQSGQGYPDGRLITVKTSDDIDSKVYASQSILYNEPDFEGIKWRVLILSPGSRSVKDEILLGSSAFIVVLTLTTVGVVLCAFFFVILYRKRTERVVILGDWRFTCAFILGCVLLNTSSYALVGPTTDATCLLRMWTFHLTFAIALSPLFVKIYRMYVLVGSNGLQRKTISNEKAASWTIPIIVVQIVILLLSTFIVPPKAQEIVLAGDNAADELVLQRLVCANESPVMSIVRLGFEAVLILVGCILAYKTRELEKGFGECKQLLFAMYNIALVMVIIGVVVEFVDMCVSNKYLLRTIGVLWGTGFSTAAFVVPRMVQVQRQARDDRRPQPHHHTIPNYISSEI